MKSTYILLAFLLLMNGVHGFYDAYPEPDENYSVRPASAAQKWNGENFEAFSTESVLECSRDKSPLAHIDVTSGCLRTKRGGRKDQQKGGTDDSVFRMVTNSHDDEGKKIKWTDQSMVYDAMIKNNLWDKRDMLNYSGLHVFVRYQTSDDLYVASVRYDGKVTIKEKRGGVYTTLAVGRLSPSYLDKNGKLATGTWVNLKATAIGTTIKLFVDDVEVLSAKSSSLAWGTTGIRTDNAEVIFDNIQMSV